MLRLGPPPPETRAMDLDDIFLSRLKLLLIMAKAYLQGWPLGAHRCEAMLENARHVESESVDLGGLLDDAHTRNGVPHTAEFDHLFYQRVKLLAIMIKAVARGYPMGDHRKAAMRENMELLCQTLALQQGEDAVAFLKVA